MIICFSCTLLASTVIHSRAPEASKIPSSLLFLSLPFSFAPFFHDSSLPCLSASPSSPYFILSSSFSPRDLALASWIGLCLALSCLVLSCLASPCTCPIQLCIRETREPIFVSSRSNFKFVLVVVRANVSPIDSSKSIETREKDDGKSSSE